jgi:hypothetical protein
MESLHDSPAPPRAVMIITFAIALIGAIVMSLPPGETPARAMPRAVVSQAQSAAHGSPVEAGPAARATQAARRASHPRKSTRHAASLGDAPAAPAPDDCEDA